MNTYQRFQIIAKGLTKTLSLFGRKGCRKVDQFLDTQSGNLYELFKNEDGCFTVWETDSDGVTTFWDCGDRWQSQQDVNLANLSFVCDI